MPDVDQSEEEQNDMFYELNKFTSLLQHEISEALLQNPKHKKTIGKLLKKPDHEIVEAISHMIRQLIMIMPLANSYGINVFSGLFSMHSVVTKDPTIENRLNAVKTRIEKEMENE